MIAPDAIVARPRPARPQGPRRDEAGRAGGRALRTGRRGDRARAADAPSAPAGAAEADRSTPRSCSAPGLVDELKAVFEHHKGEADVHLVVQPRGRAEPLGLGDGYRVRPSSGLRAELGHVLGADALAADSPALVRARASLDFFYAGYARPKTGECRQCRSFCDKMVEPRGCVEMRLPLPLQLRRPAHRHPVRRLHAGGLRRQGRARGGAGAGWLRRRQDDRRAAAALPVLGRAGLRGRAAPAYDCVNRRFFDCADDGAEGLRAFDLRDI